MEYYSSINVPFRMLALHGEWWMTRIDKVLEYQKLQETTKFSTSEYI